MKRVYNRITTRRTDEDVIIPKLKPDEELQIYRFQWLSAVVKEFNRVGITLHNGLDIGSGNGPAAFVMLGSVEHVDAVEQHAQSASVIREVCVDAGIPLEKINVFCNTFENFVEERESNYRYDVVTMFEVIEHLRDPFYVVEQVYDLMENGGYLFISTPDQNGKYGINDNASDHIWTATVQSIITRVLCDDRRWKILQIHNAAELIHILVQKVVPV